jgi:hypothetical protein
VTGFGDFHFDERRVRRASGSAVRWHWSDENGRITGPHDEHDPTLVRFLIRWTSETDARGPVSLLVSLPGRPFARAMVTPMSLSKAVAGGPVDEIELTPDPMEGAGAGAVEATGVEAPKGFDFGPGAILLLGGGDGVHGGVYEGRRTARGVYEFRGLPEGRFHGHIGLGFRTQSDPFDVTIASAATVRLPVTFDSRAWITMEAVDPVGRLLPGVGMVTKYTSEGGKPVGEGQPIEIDTTVSVSAETGVRTSAIFNVEPGRYIFSAMGANSIGGLVEVDAAKGQVNRVVFHFAPLGTKPR